MNRGAWWATVHWVAKSQTRLSDFTFKEDKGVGQNISGGREVCAEERESTKDLMQSTFDL